MVKYSYPSGLFDPLDIPAPGETLFKNLVKITNKYPDNEALVDPFQRLTFTQYRDISLRFGYMLHELGVKRGDRVISIMPNWAEAAFGWYGTSIIGAIWVPVSLAFRERELRYIFQNIAPKIVIIAKEFGGFKYLELVQKLRSELNADFTLLVKGEGELKNALPLDKLMNQEFDIDESWAEFHVSSDYNEADSPCLITHTSGSTGQPKGAIHTHNTILIDCKNVAKVSGTTHDDIFLNPLPMCHQFGIEAGTAFAVVNGSKVVLVDSFKPKDFLQKIEDERATFIVGVPTMYKLIIQHPDFPCSDVSSIRAGLVGGAICLKADREEMLNKLGEIINIAGMTEASVLACTSFDDTWERKVVTAGRMLPGGKAKVVDDTGEVLSPNEAGELFIKGPNITIGYWGQPELNKQKFTRDGWLKTGDIAKIDEDGFITYLSRVDDRIVRGGYKIFPVEVERVLITHEKVQSACLVGVPNPILNESTVACVQLQPNASLTKEEIKEFCEQRIAKYLVPDFIEIMDEMPLSPTGKILVKEIRKMMEEKYTDVNPRAI